MYRINILILVLIISACNSTKKTAMGNDSANKLTQKEKNNGWQLLFDGSTTNGWHSYGKTYAGKAWKVEDGVLHLDAASKKTMNYEGIDLVTDQEFGDFDLKLQWKISKNGNSGIMFNVNENPAKYAEPYFTGPEMQVLDNAGHPDGKIYKHHAGDLYDLIASPKDASKPVGEWNQVEIIVKNGKLDLYLNGEHTVNTTMWDDNWKKMVAGSKFKAWPDFGTFRRGHIDLQDHGDNVWFRDIKIRPL